MFGITEFFIVVVIVLGVVASPFLPNLPEHLQRANRSLRKKNDQLRMELSSPEV